LISKFAVFKSLFDFIVESDSIVNEACEIFSLDVGDELLSSCEELFNIGNAVAKVSNLGFEKFDVV